MTNVEPTPETLAEQLEQLEHDRQAVAQQQALLTRMQRGRESQQAAFVQDMDRRYAALAEKERLLSQKFDALDRVLAHLENPTL